MDGRAAAASFLEGGGELGALMRAYDWTSTPLGPPADWPRSLKTAVRIMLTSRQPFWLGWGPDLTYLYNDPYKSIIGGKHPWALGRPFHEVWREIWPVVGPMAQQVIDRDEGIYAEEQLLIMERHGYQEETYYTFSYSPVPDDEGRIAGLICANTEDTGRVIGERQLALLRELASTTGNARTWQDACALAASALATNPRDLPFAILYMEDGDGQLAACAATAGSEHLHPPGLWPLPATRDDGALQVVPLAHMERVPRGDWPRAPDVAAMLPIVPSGETGRRGALVVGLNPFRRFDAGYRGFLELTVGQIAAAIANAEAYEQERRRAEALAELDKAKTTFFSNVSHEFRTPLTLMLGPIEDLVSGSPEMNPRDRALLEVVQRNGERLLKLVNTLLDFARIEAGRAQTSFQSTDLAAATAELAGSFREACERAGLVLAIDCPPASEPAWIDREMWEKVVLNLLSNAFKFTMEGTITVRVRESGDAFLVSVADTGTGIPQAALPHMFERFYRVEGAQGRSHEGSGIGLALVQELVRLHGGEITVQSNAGEGTVFSIALPKGRAHLPASRIDAPKSAAATQVRAAAYVDEALSWLPSARVEEAAAGQPGPRVLVADDNADLREYVRRLLAESYTVETAVDGENALESIRRRPPDLVVADVMMPRLDGFGLVRALRDDPKLQSLPIILLSARAGEEARIEGMASGADDYLVKPFSARELLVRAGALLKTAELRRTAERRKDEFIATLSHELRNPLAPIRNSLHLLALTREGNPQLTRIHDMMTRQVNHLVRLVDDLLEISRISRGTLELRKERIELATIVRNAIETAEPHINAGAHELEVELPGEAVMVHGDVVRLGQVLANVLNNAAKYSERGGCIRLAAQAAGHFAEISVRDTGMGIPADELERIFEMFTRGRQRSGQGGLGIGLALARQLVQMHGGSIEAHSAGPGQGSEFLIRLPLAETAQRRPALTLV